MENTLPSHWIGVRKHFLDTCTSFCDALVSVPPMVMSTHSYGIGGTGSGKTTGIHQFIAQDVSLGHSFVVLDMRGDLVSAALEICAGRVPEQKIALFDLREKERPLGFNPLFGAGEPYYRALAVLDAIGSINELGVQTSETLRNTLLLLTEAGESLTNLEALFTEAAFRRRLLAQCKSQSVLSFWQRYDQLSKDRQAGLTGPVLNKVSLLNSTQGLRRMLGHQTPLDLGRHLNTPGSVTLVALACEELHSASRMMGSFFLSAICREIFARVTVPETQRVPVRIYVDEFENFSMNDFESLLAEGRRFKCSLFLAHQTLAQLTPRMRSMVLNNVGVKLVFRSGREDAATLSKDLTGDSKALDIAGLSTGEAFLWVRGEEPIHIELNDPLLESVGGLSPEAQRLVDALTASVPPFEQPLRHSTDPAQTSESCQSPPKSLEDWL